MSLRSRSYSRTLKMQIGCSLRYAFSLLNRINYQLYKQIIDASKAWRDSWTSILGAQHRLIDEFNGMFSPIIGAGESYSGHEPAPTPEKTMEKTTRLRDNYEALKTDLLEEVNLVDSRMVKPAMEAKDYIQPMKKTIKNREDKKVELDMHQSVTD